MIGRLVAAVQNNINGKSTEASERFYLWISTYKTLQQNKPASKITTMQGYNLEFYHLYQKCNQQAFVLISLHFIHSCFVTLISCEFNWGSVLFLYSLYSKETISSFSLAFCIFLFFSGSLTLSSSCFISLPFHCPLTVFTTLLCTHKYPHRHFRIVVSCQVIFYYIHSASTHRK